MQHLVGQLELKSTNVNQKGAGMIERVKLWKDFQSNSAEFYQNHATISSRESRTRFNLSSGVYTGI